MKICTQSPAQANTDDYVKTSLFSLSPKSSNTVKWLGYVSHLQSQKKNKKDEARPQDSTTRSWIDSSEILEEGGVVILSKLDCCLAFGVPLPFCALVWLLARGVLIGSDSCRLELPRLWRRARSQTAFFSSSLELTTSLQLFLRPNLGDFGRVSGSCRTSCRSLTCQVQRKKNFNRAEEKRVLG